MGRKIQDFAKRIERIEYNNYHLMISTCWASATNFSYLKQIGFATLSSTYKCEQKFSQMRIILIKNRNRLTTKNSDAYICLKTTNYKPNLTKSLLTSKRTFKNKVYSPMFVIISLVVG